MLATSLLGLHTDTARYRQQTHTHNVCFIFARYVSPVPAALMAGGHEIATLVYQKELHGV